MVDIVLDKLIQAVEDLASVVGFGTSCEKTREGAKILGRILADMAALREQRKPKE